MCNKKYYINSKSDWLKEPKKKINWFKLAVATWAILICVLLIHILTMEAI